MRRSRRYPWLFVLSLLLAAGAYGQVTLGTDPAVPRMEGPAIDPDTFGISLNYDWVSMEDFQPFYSDPLFFRNLTDFYWQRSGAGPTPYVAGYLRLDSGVNVSLIRFFYYDDNLTENPTFFVCVHEVDDSIGSNLFNNCALNEAPTATQPGYSSYAISIPPEMNPYVRAAGGRERRWLLLASIPAIDGTIKFGGARAMWSRQVSPAPDVASFGDVPTTSPLFQFVEALVASGVTAGCGGGNYCPNDPITRGQMAVFIAKALGLHFSP